MPDLEFDTAGSFESNLEAFLAEMGSADAEMAAILRANIDKLRSIVANGERDAQVRSEFNESVLAALDALLLEQSSEAETSVEPARGDGEAT